MTTPPIPKPPAGTSKWQVTTGKKRSPQRVVLYGTGGIGKSSLAALAPSPIFLDVEDGTGAIDLTRIGSDLIKTYEDLRAALGDPVVRKYSTVVIDTLTKVQELATNFVLRTKKVGGDTAKSIEDYGYGKGQVYLYEAMNLILGDLDRIIEGGTSVIVICHDTVSRAPNPSGDDFLRYEPNLAGGAANKNSVRDRVKSWCDHMLYLQYDRTVEDGKATGRGTRTIYCQERPDYWAKSRELRDPIPYREGDGTVWTKVFGGAK